MELSRNARFEHQREIAGGLLHPPPLLPPGPRRASPPCRYQTLPSLSDEVFSPCRAESLTDESVVLGITIMYESPLDTLFPILRDMDLIEGEGIKPCVVDSRRYAHRRWSEVLNLLGVEIGVAYILGELDHVADPAPRVARHKVWDEVLTSGLPLLQDLKLRPKLVKDLTGRFSHAGTDRLRYMFRCDFEVPGDVLPTYVTEVFTWRDEVIPDP